VERFDGFRFPLTVDRTLGRFRKEGDYSAYIVQLIKQVLLTAPGERGASTGRTSAPVCGAFCSRRAAMKRQPCYRRRFSKASIAGWGS
jgi:hypothetical protein